MKSHPLFPKQRIFAPGPTPVPEEVLAAMSLATMHHRTKGFIDVLARVREGLSFLFQTKEPVFTLASSGTGAMEATVTNLLDAGDTVIVINGGKFGERWTKIAERHSVNVHEIVVPWGEAAAPESVIAALQKFPQAQAVLFQASETSTGAYHPVKEIADAIRKHSEALICIDAITALGVHELPMDRWGLDVVVSGSQKALMLPPGLAFLALSARARELMRARKSSSFYFDLLEEEKAFKAGQTAWTPAVSLIVGLEVVLRRFREVGLEQVFAHHARLAEATRRGVEGMGLQRFAPTHPSNAVTSVVVPTEIRDGNQILVYLRDRFGITVAEGQDQYKGKMFRIAHLGYFDELDMLTVLAAVEMTLSHLGAPIRLGSGVGAASQYFKESACAKVS